MAKIWICCIFICSIFFASIVSQANEVDHIKQTEKELYDPEMNCTKKVKLSSAQLKQLDQIYYRIYSDYVDLIEFYSQSGALTQNQMKLRYKMLNNYIKTFYKRNYRWCSEHESDEWEEEWYNSDKD
ncbi:DUF2680 domain-containing protein [Bacillus methanolicus]|uniref:DUF2680 domain-containing protein n=1 Tax=Bacillus methanolicus TaxID=1471 RepID=UPI00200EAA40|nr:DUF2680 domain-containing protein [Bacillus methanolicus]UQD52255.1 DUF2680 domain-containing protein [Bacillus methanolicus]